jgi:hypothetical protein
VPRGQLVRVRGYIRTENAEAANICLQCWGPDGETLVGFASTPVIEGTHDWKRFTSDPIVVPRDTSAVIVRAALTGKGRAWFDDVSLDVVGAKVSADPGIARAVEGRIVEKLAVTRDAMVLSYMPDWKHGNLDNLGVDNNDGGVRTLVAWKNAPRAEQKNVRYLLAMYARETRVRERPGKIEAHAILENWDETVGWKDQPKVSENPVAEYEVEPGKGWKFFDVTPLVRKAGTEPKKLPGVMLRFDDENRNGENRDWSGYQFVSREGIGEWESRRPMLLMVDPDQEAVVEPAGESDSQVQPVAVEISTEQMLEYLEYLTSLKGTKIREAPGSATAMYAAQQAASEAVTKNNGPVADMQASHIRMQRSQMPAFEQFVAKYPLTPDGLTTLSSILSWLYAQAGMNAEALRAAAVCSRLGAGTELAALVEINRAAVEEIVGKHESAEKRLKRVIGAESAKFKDRRASDILLIAPLALADLFRDQKKNDAAEQMYKRVIDQGISWDEAHPEKQIGASYAVAAYLGRARLVQEGEEKEKAFEELRAEARKRLPAAAGQFESELEMMKSLAPPAGTAPTDGSTGVTTEQPNNANETR